MDHNRTITGDRICPATEDGHQCDLDVRHTGPEGRSRHMCFCGRYFDGDE